MITNKKRQSLLKDLVRVLKHVRYAAIIVSTIPEFHHKFAPIQESYSYRDPITEFVECLYVNFDFDMAQQKLLECEKVRIHNITYVANVQYTTLPLQ